MQFAQPAWLVLLVLLPLLGGGAALVARLRQHQWAAFVAPRLRGRLLKHGSPLPRWLALLFLLAAVAAIIHALARPQGTAGTKTEKALGRNLLIALDLSRSMRVSDVKPDRLARAKMVIYELLDAMPNERVGLIGFAGTAYVYAPLTVDHRAVRETVEQIDETWVPVGGSNLAAAIQLATETLKKTGQPNSALVVLSDGEKHEGNLDAMAAAAAQAGVYILAIGVGTEDGDYVPNPEFPGNRMVGRNGKPVISRLQPDVLRKLAAQTKGRYALAGTGMDIPAMVKYAVKDLTAFEMEGRERTVFIEFYQWLVLPAIVLLLGSILAATRWRRIGATATLAAGVFLTPPDVHAGEGIAASRTLSQQQYQTARDSYQKLADDSLLPARTARFRLGEAAAAYQAGDFQHARSAFSDALRSADRAVLANAHTGMGNTLFQLGWKSLADAPYPGNGKPAPTLEKFDAIVKDRLAKLSESADPAPGEAAGYASIDVLITNWADAVRHYDSALAVDSSDKIAAANHLTTMIYLKRLGELLEKDKQQTEQSLPQPQPGEGQPQPGEGDPKDKQDGKAEGDKGSQPPGGTGHGEENPKDGKSNNDERSPDKPGTKPDDDKGPAKSPADPEETPAQQARRILKENADLEKGPLTPGRIEHQAPKQDW